MGSHKYSAFYAYLQNLTTTTDTIDIDITLKNEQYYFKDKLLFSLRDVPLTEEEQKQQENAKTREENARKKLINDEKETINNILKNIFKTIRVNNNKSNNSSNSSKSFFKFHKDESFKASNIKREETACNLIAKYRIGNHDSGLCIFKLKLTYNDLIIYIFGLDTDYYSGLGLGQHNFFLENHILLYESDNTSLTSSFYVGYHETPKPYSESGKLEIRTYLMYNYRPTSQIDPKNMTQIIQNFLPSLVGTLQPKIEEIIIDKIIIGSRTFETFRNKNKELYIVNLHTRAILVNLLKLVL